MNPVLVSAPSNIALIKYMGKIEGSGNKPTNGSMSYTLENLRTFVRLTPIPGDKDQWQALVREDLQPLSLSEKGQQYICRRRNRLSRVGKRRCKALRHPHFSH